VLPRSIYATPRPRPVGLWTTQGRCPQSHRHNNSNSSTNQAEGCKQSVLDVSEHLSSISPARTPLRGEGWGEGPPRVVRVLSPPCMIGRPNQRKLKVRWGRWPPAPTRMGGTAHAPWVFGTVGEHGPSVLRLLSSTDDREHVPHARQGSVRTRDQGQV